ncbi:carbohydrate ABC transporter permease [[Eubacterium] cellulosolvens]
MSDQPRLKTGFLYLIIIFFTIWTLFPFYWMVGTSLKLEDEYWAIPPTWIPMKPNWRNYSFFIETLNIRNSFFHSLFIGLVSTFITIIIGSLAGYYIARFNFRGKRDVAFWILSQRMFPAIVIALPIFIMYKSLGMLDTYHGMILVYTAMNLPFAVWILRSFFTEIPPDMEESAMIDGSSRLGALFRIIIPLAAPGMIATAILCFIFCWNEFLFALVLTRESARTLPLEIAALRSTESWRFGQISAVVVIATVPIIIFTLLVQRYIIRGLTLGGVKG